MKEHAADIAGIFEGERELPENAQKDDIALRTEIAKRCLAAANEDEIERMQTMIKTEYDAKVAEKAHLETAEPSDPAVVKKYAV